MSLTSFLDIKDVNDRLKPLRPKMPRSLTLDLLVEPKTNHRSTVGTAFDYLLRFEIKRRAPNAVEREYWVAEPGPFPDAKTLDRAFQITASARIAYAEYLRTERPRRAQLEQLAAHAIRLAKVDVIVRSGYIDPTLEEADPSDIEDLTALLKVVPFDRLLDAKTMILNPTFGRSSMLVGGADADLIAGNVLIDFKTVVNSVIKPKDLDQLLGYWLLGRHERRTNTSFPEVNSAGIYFARHGHLWTVDVSAWTQHPEFVAVEDWFFSRAAERFGGRRAQP